MAAGHKTGGRQKGTPNKRTIELQQRTEAAAVKVAAALGDAFDGDAHALLMAVYKDPEQPMKMRIEAAGKAISYEKPSLQSIDVTSLNEHIVHDVSDRPIDRDGASWLEQHGSPH